MTLIATAQIAERDAEIANLERWRDALIKQAAEQIAEIAALRAQVAELEAWKAMVPISALLRQYSKTPMGTADYELDAIDVAVWLDAMAPD